LEPDEEVIDRRRHFDPLRPGISIGHEAVSAGTLGAFAYDRQTSRRGILSNWHVLAASDEARPGDPIVQPGPKHGGRAPQDTIARLERFLLGLQGDAAFAVLNASRDVNETQLETDVLVTEVRRVQVGDIVMKSGRTTGITRGLVEGIGQYTLPYRVGMRTIAGFKIVPEEDGNPQDVEISSGGDSGSLWFTIADNVGVGLHFAGETSTSPGEEHALACHLDDVLSELDVTLQPTGAVPPPPPEPEVISLAQLAGRGAQDDVTRLLLESVVRLARVLEHTIGVEVMETKPESTNGAGRRPKTAKARRKKRR
jgi:endonuclease G